MFLTGTTFQLQNQHEFQDDFFKVPTAVPVETKRAQASELLKNMLYRMNQEALIGTNINTKA